MNFFSILAGVLLFSLLVFIHELGHFLAAKASGVQVNEFSIFMGPAIFKKQVGETLYAIRCIPFGGYCAMEGEDGESENPRSFGHASWWKRLIILAAGATMNFLAGILLLAIVYAPTEQFIVPVIDSFEEGCTLNGPGGLQVGDEILEVDGEKIYVSGDFSMMLSLNPGETHDLVVKRNGQKVVLEDFRMETREFPNEDGTTSPRFGMTFSLRDADFGYTTKYIFASSVDMVRTVRLSLQMICTGKAGIEDVSGPVGIVQQLSEVASASETAKAALLNILYFGALITINLAVMNLLPIPALDGGRIFLLVITTVVEAVTHKKINPKYEAWIHGVGMVLLLILMALILFKDIFVIFKG